MIVNSISIKVAAPLFMALAIISCSSRTENDSTLAEVNSTKEVESPSYKKAMEINPGKDIFKKLNCSGCHMKNASIVGPSLKKIRKVYQDQEKDLYRFLMGDGKPKIDPEEYVKMAPSIEAFQKLTKEDQQKLIDYLLDK